MSDEEPPPMPVGEQCSAFVGEINNVVDRFRQEFNLPIAAVIGCLEMVKLGIFYEAMEEDDEDA